MMDNQNPFYEEENQPSLHELLPRSKKLTPTDEQIVECYLEKSIHCTDKVAVELVAQATGVSVDKINKALAKAGAKDHTRALREQLRQKIVEDKIPVVKEVVGLTLHALRDWLEKFTHTDPETGIRRSDFMSPAEAKSLSGIAKELNELLRLETGQTTANIGINITNVTQEQVIEVLNQMKELDPLLIEDIKEVDDGD